MHRCSLSLSALLFLVVLAGFSPAAYAARIAVLDFELNDLTLAPQTEAELVRTRSIKPALETALLAAGHTIVPVSSKAQEQADRGFGYLFEHSDVAAQLGQSLPADYILVGRLHKPSFLFAYLMLHLVDAKSGKLVGDYIAEAKGAGNQATLRAVDVLVESLHKVLPAAAENTAAPAYIPLSAVLYRQTSSKLFADVIADLLFAISQNNFRLTEHAKIGEAIAERESIHFPQLAVLHFCNLTYARELIEKKPEFAARMPCRISVRQDGDRVIVEALLLPEDAPEIHEFAQKINQILQQIVDSGVS